MLCLVGGVEATWKSDFALERLGAVNGEISQPCRKVRRCDGFS